MKTPPLIVENFEDVSNYTFLTLIEFKKQRYLTVVENVVADEIHAYVLDRLEAEGIDPDWFMAGRRWSARVPRIASSPTGAGGSSAPHGALYFVFLNTGRFIIAVGG